MTYQALFVGIQQKTEHNTWVELPQQPKVIDTAYIYNETLLHVHLYHRAQNTLEYMY